MPFLLPLLFQIGFGLNPFQSGTLVLAVFAGNIAMKPFTTPLLRRFNFRSILIVNGLINAAVIFALLTPATPVAIIMGLLFASGLTRSMQFTALLTLAFAEVPEEWMSGANTLLNIAQQLAMGMGIAAGVIALRIAGLFGSSAPGAIPLASFHIAFVVVGASALLGVVNSLGLDPAAGDAVRRPKAAAVRPPRQANASPA